MEVALCGDKTEGSVFLPGVVLTFSKCLLSLVHNNVKALTSHFTIFDRLKRKAVQLGNNKTT